MKLKWGTVAGIVMVLALLVLLIVLHLQVAQIRVDIRNAPQTELSQFVLKVIVFIDGDNKTLLQISPGETIEAGAWHVTPGTHIVRVDVFPVGGRGTAGGPNGTYYELPSHVEAFSTRTILIEAY